MMAGKFSFEKFFTSECQVWIQSLRSSDLLSYEIRLHVWYAENMGDIKFTITGERIHDLLLVFSVCLTQTEDSGQVTQVGDTVYFKNIHLMPPHSPGTSHVSFTVKFSDATYGNNEFISGQSKAKSLCSNLTWQRVNLTE